MTPQFPRLIGNRSAIALIPTRCPSRSDPGLAGRTKTGSRAMPVPISSSTMLRMAGLGFGRSSTPRATPTISPPHWLSCADRVPSQHDSLPHVGLSVRARNRSYAETIEHAQMAVRTPPDQECRRPDIGRALPEGGVVYLLHA